MLKLIHKAIFLIAIMLLLIRAEAQNVYRCGDAYSQTPCAGGTSIETRDERTRSQKSQSDAAIQKDNKIAETMEKSRLKQEASQAKSNTSSSGKTADEKTTPVTEKKSVAAQRKKPEYFTAKTATEPKKKNESEKEKSTTR